jgi:hypothetical protein
LEERPPKGIVGPWLTLSLSLSLSSPLSFLVLEVKRFARMCYSLEKARVM